MEDPSNKVFKYLILAINFGSLLLLLAVARRFCQDGGASFWDDAQGCPLGHDRGTRGRRGTPSGSARETRRRVRSKHE
jgi:hypothetical protein